MQFSLTSKTLDLAFFVAATPDNDRPLTMYGQTDMTDHFNSDVHVHVYAHGVATHNPMFGRIHDQIGHKSDGIWLYSKEMAWKMGRE